MSRVESMWGEQDAVLEEKWDQLQKAGFEYFAPYPLRDEAGRCISEEGFKLRYALSEKIVEGLKETLGEENVVLGPNYDYKTDKPTETEGVLGCYIRITDQA